MNSIEEQKNMLIKGNQNGDFGEFVKFKNTNEFPGLSLETADFLKIHGVYSYENSYPFLTSDGKLKKYDDINVIIGNGKLNIPFLINTETDEVTSVNFDSEEPIIISKSIQKYIEIKYIFKKYFMEVRLTDALGDYDTNNAQYASKLKAMLEEIEPDIMSFNVWAIKIEEIELGII